MCDVQHSHRDGHNHPASKPRACEGEKVIKLFNIRAKFNKKEKIAKAKLEKVLNAVLDKPSQETAGKSVSSVAVEGKKVAQSVLVGQGDDIKRSRSIASINRVMKTCMLLCVRVIELGLLCVVKHSPLLPMHRQMLMVAREGPVPILRVWGYCRGSEWFSS